MDQNKCLKIIFNLCDRKKYIERYFKLLKKYQANKLNFDILIINDCNNYLNKTFLKDIETKIIVKKLTTKITGMNTMFTAINGYNSIIEKYSYVCFVEDDNFIFPKGIYQSIKFLEKNNRYVGCGGLSFLYEKKHKFVFLAPYHTPNFFSNSLIKRAIQYQNNGGLVYYSVIRKKIFLKICKEISLIKDDNLSEVFFNYLLLISGNLKKINDLYLAREYPRPKIYNIPSLKDWLKNTYLLKDVHTIIISINKNINTLNIDLNKSLFFRITIFYYIYIRINSAPKQKNGFKKIITSFKKRYQILKNKSQITEYLKNLNN